MHVITCGNTELVDPSILASQRFADLIARLRLDYKTILIDSPPLAYLPDARLLFRRANGVILVCRAGQTTLDEIAEAARVVEEDGSLVIGTVLNDWNPNAANPGYYRAYSAYQETEAQLNREVAGQTLARYCNVTDQRTRTALQLCADLVSITAVWYLHTGSSGAALLSLTGRTIPSRAYSVALRDRRLVATVRAVGRRSTDGGTRGPMGSLPERGTCGVALASAVVVASFFALNPVNPPSRMLAISFTILASALFAISRLALPLVPVGSVVNGV